MVGIFPKRLVMNHCINSIYKRRSDQISQFLDSLAVSPNQWTAFIDIKQAQTSAQWVVRHYGISRRDSKTSLVRRLIVDGMRQLRGIKD